MKLNILLALSILALAANAAAAGEVKFEMHRISNVRSEACGAGDFNNDGKMDIVAGPNLYLAPDFKPVKIREISGEVTDDGKGYADDFMNEPLDVDGDGNLDVVSVAWFAKSASWFRNPGPGKEGLWEEHLITGGQKSPAVAAPTAGKAKKGKAEKGKAGKGQTEKGAGKGKAETILGDNHETGALVDVDGDGKAREILPHIKPTKWYEFTKGADGKVTPVIHVISNKEMDFGVGVGDITGDGRPDVIRPDCWYEAPADPRKGEWKEHAFAESLIITQPDRKPPIAKHISMVLVHDVNGDGLNDLVCTMAHGYGIFWMEQQPSRSKLEFHVVDPSNEQAIGPDGKLKPGVTIPPGAEIATVKDAHLDRQTGQMRYTEGAILIKKKAEITEKDLHSASVRTVKEDVENPIQIILEFDVEKFATATQNNVGKRLAIMLNGTVRSAPILKTPITDGRAVIRGAFTQEEANELCTILNEKSGGEITFTRHMIDKTWTQAHAIALADLDGDGTKELVTGKRYMAHNGNDPEETGPLGVYYYKPVGKGQDVKWEKHIISFDQKVGTSLNIPIADLDGDGDLDIVATGKWGGPVWFENKTK